jgi:hypothetical protein
MIVGSSGESTQPPCAWTGTASASIVIDVTASTIFFKFISTSFLISLLRDPDRSTETHAAATLYLDQGSLTA